MAIYKFLNSMDVRTTEGRGRLNKEDTRHLVGVLLSEHQTDLLELDRLLGKSFGLLRDRFKPHTKPAYAEEIRVLYLGMCEHLAQVLFERADAIARSEVTPLDEVVDNMVLADGIAGLPLELLLKKCDIAKAVDGVHSARKPEPDSRPSGIPQIWGVATVGNERPSVRRPATDEVTRRTPPDNFDPIGAVVWLAQEAQADVDRLLPGIDSQIVAVHTIPRGAYEHYLRAASDSSLFEAERYVLEAVQAGYISELESAAILAKLKQLTWEKTAKGKKKPKKKAKLKAAKKGKKK